MSKRLPACRFASNPLPVPASGLAASHRELRLALGALRVVAHDPVAPPEGHGLWAIARRAVHDLDRALARHLALPHPVPAKAATQSDLELQHTALVVLAVALGEQLAATHEGSQADWQALGRPLARVIDRLERHLDLEEGLAGGSDGLVKGGATRRAAPSPSIA